MYHKVFINNAEIVFADHAIAGYLPIPALPENHDLEVWLATLRALDQRSFFVVIDEDGTQWQHFVQRHVGVVAAGGLVTNKEGNLLVIKRLGYWDLPKGKLDAGETPEQCALREVTEECGIEHLKLGAPLENTYHTYHYKGQNVLKTTHWFDMKYEGKEEPKPQHAEDITQALFAMPHRVLGMMENTYPSLLPLFEAYLSRNK